MGRGRFWHSLVKTKELIEAKAPLPPHLRSAACGSRGRCTRPQPPPGGWAQRRPALSGIAREAGGSRSSWEGAAWSSAGLQSEH